MSGAARWGVTLGESQMRCAVLPHIDFLFFEGYAALSLAWLTFHIDFWCLPQGGN